MYSRKRTLTERITYTNKTIDLPRDAVIDAILLRCYIVLSNSGASAWNGTYEDVLKAIKEVRVVSNGTNIHYALTGNDVAIVNYYDKASKSVNPDDAVSVGAGASASFEILLTLDAGDIIALEKDSLKLTIEFETSIATNVSLDTSNSYVEVTLEEDVYAPDEEIPIAGEPKVYALEKSFATLGELSEVLELPVDTLLHRAFLVFKDGTGARSDSVDEKYGIIQTSPERIELYNIGYNTARLYDKQEYNLDAALTGVSVLDYGEEVTKDGLGIRAWRLNKGDLQLALKTSANGTVRYISHEFVVDTELVDAVDTGKASPEEIVLEAD
jgi:hypothetical protein